MWRAPKRVEMAPQDVSILYQMEKRFLYFPYITPSKPSVYKRVEVFKNDKRTRTNPTVYFDGKRTMKLYERGNDNNKYGDGWVFESLDRVRMEYTARGKALTDKGIRALEDFIKGPRFSFYFLFKQFRRDSPFPVDGDFTEILYQQYDLWKKGKGEDPSRFAKKVVELEPLRLDLMKPMGVFQTEWNSSG